VQFQIEKHIASDVMTNRDGCRSFGDEQFEPNLEHAYVRGDETRAFSSFFERSVVERVNETLCSDHDAELLIRIRDEGQGTTATNVTFGDRRA